MLNRPPWTTAPLTGPAAGTIEVFMDEASASIVKVVVEQCVKHCCLRRSRYCMLKALSSVSMTYSSVAL